MSPPSSTLPHPARDGAPDAPVATARPGVRGRARFQRILAAGPDGAALAAAKAVARVTGARVVEGRPAERTAGRSIAMLACREAADLVAVATGLKSSAEIERLVRPALDTGLAALVIPSGARAGLRLERIGVGYNGGPAARRALTCAADLVGLAGPTVASVTVAYVDGEGAEPNTYGLQSGRETMIEWWLESVADDIRATVRPLRLEGDPAEALADLSQELDLLVVGTRPPGWLRRLVAGSVSTGLFVQTRCPLLVVPEQ